MKSTVFLALTAAFFSLAQAEPAAWFRWHSPQADYEVCAQFAPGSGWIIVKGPFEDSGCKKLKKN